MNDDYEINISDARAILTFIASHPELCVENEFPHSSPSLGEVFY